MSMPQYRHKRNIVVVAPADIPLVPLLHLVQYFVQVLDPTGSHTSSLKFVHVPTHTNRPAAAVVDKLFTNGDSIHDPLDRFRCTSVPFLLVVLVRVLPSKKQPKKS